ncbi:coiled-coil domain-containing protein 125-like isoform X3 [Delphinapterus leucas]|uniref:Coiled-coil domain-containing protein 125-like isoform X3 n=1 Tax=Delphinapterus leucas TaxID=9749 RepID=A0A2Y9Q865_DELLE|nr:coiled-coil domain-containing protein 125-like isoform X3 [Delphinapterus leucas]
MSREARPQSEAEGQAWEAEDDDMAEGDLGYGLRRRPGGIYEVQVSHLFTSRKRSDGKAFSPPPFSRNGEERNSAVFQYSKHKSLHDTHPEGPQIPYHGRQSSTVDSNSELSNVELRQRLQETLEEVEILKTELEASQRHLEGKEEALRILQSNVRSYFYTFIRQYLAKPQVIPRQCFKKLWNKRDPWRRLNCENAVLKETLKLKTEEIKMLKSENTILNQQYLEALAMLDIKQQKMAQENTCQDTSGFTEVSGLELAVLGACLCHGPRGSPCTCARLAASTRKMLLQVKQELELLQKSKEEAYIMADAFRIAFEQQLMRKNDQALRLTQMDKMCKKATKGTNWKHLKDDGLPSQRSKKTLGQKLLGMLPLENSSKSTDDQHDPQEVFKMLTDLLNDKEEALAHQRKVSYMLARALEDRGTTSKENKEKNPMKDNSPLKNPWQKTSEFPVLHDPVHSSVQIFNSVGCICSIQHFQTDQYHTRTLKRSYSLPSNIMY